MKEAGKKIRELRLQRGLSQAELARRTGLHPSTISHIEGGRFYLAPKWRRQIAAVLEVSEDELVDKN